MEGSDTGSWLGFYLSLLTGEPTNGPSNVRVSGSSYMVYGFPQSNCVKKTRWKLCGFLWTSLGSIQYHCHHTLLVKAFMIPLILKGRWHKPQISKVRGQRICDHLSNLPYSGLSLVCVVISCHSYWETVWKVIISHFSMNGHIYSSHGGTTVDLKIRVIYSIFKI